MAWRARATYDDSGVCTTIIASNVFDAKGCNSIKSAGNQGPGVDEPDRLDIAFLPADVDQDGMVAPVDLLRFRQIQSGVFTPPKGLPEDFADTNRDGAVEPLDLLRFRQLLFGTGNATTAWTGKTLNASQP